MEGSKYFQDVNHFRETKRSTFVDGFRNEIGSESIRNGNFDFVEPEQKHKGNFENEKLNEDFAFVKNRITLSELSKIKSKEQNRNSHKNDLKQLSESTIHAKFPSQKWGKSQLKITKGANMTELENPFTPFSFGGSAFQQKPTSGVKDYSRSMELLALAIISAIFVSLGSNMKQIFFSS